MRECYYTTPQGLKQLTSYFVKKQKHMNAILKAKSPPLSLYISIYLSIYLTTYLYISLSLLPNNADVN